MILTGKAEVDFIKWASYNYGEDSGDLAMMREVYRNGLIIEFFDSVGYTIDRDSYNRKMTITDWINGDENQIIIDCTYLEPFKEWWIEAIEKANDIYNEKNNLI